MKDLKKYSKVIKKATDGNFHGKVRMILAFLTEDKVLIKKVKATQIICNLEKQNPIHEYTYKLFKQANELGEKKYGKENWEKYIGSKC
jgi:hypothetical protein